MNPHIQSCAELLRKGDPDRFLAVMSVPAKYRARLFVIYAFNLEISRIPYVTQEPMIAQMRLQFWRDVVEEAFAHKKPRAHEVAQPLAEIIHDKPIAKAEFDRVIDARNWDIEIKEFTTEVSLFDHLASSGGALARIAAMALDADDLNAERARLAGAAGALARWLSVVPQLKAHGLKPLPDDSETGILNLVRSGQMQLKSAYPIKGPARLAVRADWMAAALLRKAARKPAAAFNGDLDFSEGYKKLRLIFKR